LQQSIGIMRPINLIEMSRAFLPAIFNARVTSGGTSMLSAASR